MSIQQVFLLISIFIDSLLLVKVYEVSNKAKADFRFICLCIISLILPPFSYLIHPSIEIIIYVVEPIFIYIYLKKYKKWKNYLALFMSFFLYNAVNTTRTFLDVFFSSLTGDEFFYRYIGYIGIILSTISIYTILFFIKYFKFDFTYFKEKNFQSLIENLGQLLLGNYIVLRFSDFLSQIPHFNSSASMIATVSFLGFLAILFYLRAFRERYEKEVEIKQKIKEQKLFQKYTNEIVSLYNEIRGFRHNYAGMLVSLNTSIQTGNMENVKNVYKNVLREANISLRSDKYTYFDLNNVEDAAFRSLLTEALLRAKEENLDLTFEIKEKIERVNLPLLELVRLTSILLDNAIEAACDTYYKKLNISLVKLDQSVVFIIQNSYKQKKIDVHQIFEPGFSTKGNSRGMGLNNVKEIIKKYENLMIDTEVTDEFFTQVVTFHKF